MFNKAVLIGRLTADPELRSTGSGIHVTQLTLAVDRRFKGQDGQKATDFLTVVCWRQQAEFVCKYFHKGDAVGVEGSIQARSYEDKQGNRRTAVEIQADNVFFVGSKGQDGDRPRTNTAALQNDGFEEMETDDDLPFN